jgi:hypothetical protein
VRLFRSCGGTPRPETDEYLVDLAALCRDPRQHLVSWPRRVETPPSKRHRINEYRFGDATELIDINRKSGDPIFLPIHPTNHTINAIGALTTHRPLAD